MFFPPTGGSYRRRLGFFRLRWKLKEELRPKATNLRVRSAIRDRDEGSGIRDPG